MAKIRVTPQTLRQRADELETLNNKFKNEVEKLPARHLTGNFRKMFRNLNSLLRVSWILSVCFVRMRMSMIG